MHRLSIVFLFILFLFSCNRHLVVREVNTKNIAINSQVASIDLAIDSMVKPYRDSLQKEMSTLVAVSAAPLVKGKPESKLTNLVADILLDFGNNYTDNQSLNIQPDAAYMNYGGLRASLPQGDITVERIFELMPFENEIVVIKISGLAFIQMADKIAARGGEGIAGFRMGIKQDKAGSITIQGKPVDLNASYWVVTSDYIANGGDQMSMFLNPPQRINTGTRIRDELIRALGVRYMEKGIIDFKEDGRIFNEQ